MLLLHFISDHTGFASLSFIYEVCKYLCPDLLLCICPAVIREKNFHFVCVCELLSPHCLENMPDIQKSVNKCFKE